jgi:prefoldin subunit 5
LHEYDANLFVLFKCLIAKNIGSLQTSSAELKQKISDLSAKRMALLAELKEVKVALTHARQEES